MPDGDVSFAEHLARFRLARSLSLTDTADLFGVTRSTVSRWCRGIIEPPAAAVRRLEFLRHEIETIDSAPILKMLVEGYDGPASLFDSKLRWLCASRDLISTFGMRGQDDLIGCSMLDTMPESTRDKWSLLMPSSLIDHHGMRYTAQYTRSEYHPLINVRRPVRMECKFRLISCEGDLMLVGFGSQVETNHDDRCCSVTVFDHDGHTVHAASFHH